jgi:hypothetical protein
VRNQNNAKLPTNQGGKSEQKSGVGERREEKAKERYRQLIDENEMVSFSTPTL